jgi:hypothetical protein
MKVQLIKKNFHQSRGNSRWVTPSGDAFFTGRANVTSVKPNFQAFSNNNNNALLTDIKPGGSESVLVKDEFERSTAKFPARKRTDR